MNADELLRVAFEQDAARALDTGRVLAGFRAKAARARKRRRATGIVVAGTVAASLLVGWAALPRPTSVPGRVLDGRPRAPVKLLYRPTWLPPGFTEVGRGVADGEMGWMQQRVWNSSSPPAGDLHAATGPTIGLQLQQAPDQTSWNESFKTENTTRVQVNGVQGQQVRDGGLMCEVTWPVGNGQALALRAVMTADPCADALRAARSVVADRAASFRPVLRATRLPAGQKVSDDSVAKTPTGCRASLRTDGPIRGLYIEAATGGDDLSEQGEELRVAGRPARYYEVAPKDDLWPPGSSVLVDLGGGRRLLVGSDASAVPLPGKRVLAELAAAVEVGAIEKACDW